MNFSVIKKMYLLLGCLYLVGVCLIGIYAVLNDLALPTLYFVWVIVGGLVLLVFRQKLKDLKKNM
ncbi:hypothetical protein [Guptibacillus spartinae]|uniref:hypothetical protein n=1 Tax=Guptibacillus spartinae TaxID=3025679 RepID=UPI0023601420|nr:hypothetical protein [Pseudalkalibacillus spartinae]